MQEIRITVPRDHTKPVNIAVNGVKGQSCTALTAGIERALGTVVNDTPTAEMYEPEQAVNMQLRQGQG